MKLPSFTIINCPRYEDGCGCPQCLAADEKRRQSEPYKTRLRKEMRSLDDDGAEIQRR